MDFRKVSALKTGHIRTRKRVSTRVGDSVWVLPHIIAVEQVAFAQVQSAAGDHWMRPTWPLRLGDLEGADFLVALRRRLHQRYHAVLVVEIEMAVGVGHRSRFLAGALA